MMAARTNRTWVRPLLWSGSRAVPGSLHGGQMATYGAPATTSVRDSMRSDRIMQWEGMRQMEDAGWGAGDTCRIALLQKTAF